MKKLLNRASKPLFAANKARAGLYYRFSDVPPTASLPLNGDLAAGYAALCLLGAKPDIGSVVCSLLGEWAGRGIVKLDKRALRLNKALGEALIGPERRLFDLMYMAAGPQEVLPYTAWQNWCRAYSYRLDEWAVLYFEKGAAWLLENALAEVPAGATIRGAQLTRAGKKTAEAFTGLHAFCSRREPDANRLEDTVWQYLAWSLLLGAARPLHKSLGVLYKNSGTGKDVPPARVLKLLHRLGNRVTNAHYHGLLENGEELPKGDGVTSAHERNALFYVYGDRAQNGVNAGIGNGSGSFGSV